jgi:hypothetical protein
MFVLICNVASSGLDLGMADGENPVTVLPGEVMEIRMPGFQPNRRTAFQFLDHHGRFAGSGEGTQKMDVVLGAADNNGLAIEAAENPAQITMQFLAQAAVVKKGLATLSRKNGMDQDFRKGLGHERGWSGHGFDSTLTELVASLPTQGRRWCANPGLSDGHSFRMAKSRRAGMDLIQLLQSWLLRYLPRVGAGAPTPGLSEGHSFRMAKSRRAGVDLIQLLQSWLLRLPTQGSRWCANPGLSDGHPYRMAKSRRAEIKRTTMAILTGWRKPIAGGQTRRDKGRRRDREDRGRARGPFGATPVYTSGYREGTVARRSTATLFASPELTCQGVAALL